MSHNIRYFEHAPGRWRDTAAPALRHAEDMGDDPTPWQTSVPHRHRYGLGGPRPLRRRERACRRRSRPGRRRTPHRWLRGRGWARRADGRWSGRAQKPCSRRRARQVPGGFARRRVRPGVSVRLPGKLRQESSNPMRFTARADGEDVTLLPLARVHHQHYPVYWLTGGGEQRIDADPLPAGRRVHVAVAHGGGTAILCVDGAEAGRNAGVAVEPRHFGNHVRAGYVGRSQYADPYLKGGGRRLPGLRQGAERRRGGGAGRGLLRIAACGCGRSALSPTEGGGRPSREGRPEPVTRPRRPSPGRRCRACASTAWPSSRAPPSPGPGR